MAKRAPGGAEGVTATGGPPPESTTPDKKAVFLPGGTGCNRVRDNGVRVWESRIGNAGLTMDSKTVWPCDRVELYHIEKPPK